MTTRLNIVLCGGCYYLWEPQMRCEHSDAPEDNLVPPTGYTPEWCPKGNPVGAGEVVSPPPSPIEERAAKYPVIRLEVQGSEILDVRLVEVTYPPSMSVEGEVHFLSEPLNEFRALYRNR